MTETYEPAYESQTGEAEGGHQAVTAIPTDTAEAVLNHSFHFSVVRNARDTTPRQVKTTWGEFLTGWLAEVEERGDLPLDEYLAADHDTRSRLKDGPGWIPALFKKGGSRKDSDVLGITAAVLDFDDGAIGLDDVEPRLAGLAFAVHTSFSHTAQKPKLRVIVPFAKVAPPALASPIFEHFNALFDGHCDPARKNPSGLYFLPACPYDAGDLYRQFNSVGALFDPATIDPPKPKSTPKATAAGVGKLIAEGGRNRHLASLAGSMRRRDMDEASILAALAEENRLKCDPPLPDQELKTIARSVSRYAPAETTASHLDEWPDPIIPGQIATPDIPADLLPGWVGDMAAAVALHTKTPEAMAVMLALSVLATVLQRRFEVAPYGADHGYTEPLSLWTLIALPPGTNKTAVLNALKHPLDRWEKLARDRMRRDMARVASERDVAAKRIETLKAQAAKAKTADEREKLRAEIQQEAEDMPAELIPPQLITTSVTPETLEQLLVDQHERMAILSDEGGIFQTMSGQYSGGVANIDVYLKGHSGSSLRVERAKRKAHVDKPALTFGLAIQPGVLAESAKTKRFRDSGLLGRFLYVLPKSNVGTRDVRERHAIPEAVKAAWEANILRLLDAMELPIGAPKVMAFEDSAREHWLDFYQKVEHQQGDGGKYEHISDWTSKLHGQVARVAGLLHLAIHGVEARTIGLDSVQRAVQLGRLLTPHAVAAFALMGASQAESDALHVYRWIKARGINEFTRREAQTALRGRFPTVKPLIEALQQLAELAIVSPECTTDSSGKGGRPSPCHLVNPKLF